MLRFLRNRCGSAQRKHEMVEAQDEEDSAVNATILIVRADSSDPWMHDV